LKVGPENLKNRTMKAILIKKVFSGDEYQYTLYLDGEVGIYAKSGAGHGWFKLSKQNCDEIFGVVDVEKLAGQEVFQEYYDWGGEVFSEDYLISKRLHFIEGFNKAMELNKDKQFTLGDMKRVFNCGRDLESIDRFEDWRTFTHFINSLEPTEIEVEIEMETCSMNPLDLDCDEIIEKPKLDSEGCLILKKIEQ